MRSSSPASVSALRCLSTAWREIGSSAASSVAVACGCSAIAASSARRRVDRQRAEHGARVADRRARWPPLQAAHAGRPELRSVRRAAGAGERHADQVEHLERPGLDDAQPGARRPTSSIVSSTRVAGSSSAAHQNVSRSASETCSTQPVLTASSESNSASPPGAGRARRGRPASRRS